MEQKKIGITINGREFSLTEQPGEMLSDLLRYRLGLTGTKIGCNESECGSCTVLMNGVPVLACTYPAAKARGKKVITIEGLADQSPVQTGFKQLHPLQEAFIKYGAVQCGFCIPGQLMTAYALLCRNPDPTEEDIKEALKDTLCRCAGYSTIIHSIQAAAYSLRTGKPVPPPDVQPSDTPRQAVGTLQPRSDAEEKVTGKAIFTDDIQFEGMLHGRVKRAMQPSAIVLKIDTSQAKELPGVRAVLTADDIPGEHNHGLVIPDWPSLVGEGEKIRTVGDAVALVVAETREIATRALDLISVEYQPLPVISDPVQANQPDAPSIHPEGNLLKHIKVRKGDMEKGFSEAEVIVEHTFHTPIYDHAFMEPECSIARINSAGRMEVYVGSQIPYSDRYEIARALKLPEDQVHVIGQLVGGGFGGKEDIAGQIHAALLAMATGRPVKLLYDRQESLIAHPKRHATQIRVKVGACRDGRLTAVEFGIVWRHRRLCLSRGEDHDARHHSLRRTL